MICIKVNNDCNKKYIPAVENDLLNEMIGFWISDNLWKNLYFENK